MPGLGCMKLVSLIIMDHQIYKNPEMGTNESKPRNGKKLKYITIQKWEIIGMHKNPEMGKNG